MTFFQARGNKEELARPQSYSGALEFSCQAMDDCEAALRGDTSSTGELPLLHVEELMAKEGFAVAFDKTGFVVSEVD